MNTVNTRGNLNNFRRGIKGEITENRLCRRFDHNSLQSRENWPTHLRGWLLGEFSDVKFRFNNAAIGATGSLCGLALAQREFIDSEYDLVFVEYAVNDNAIDSDERMRTREGLIRKLLSAGIDVVLVSMHTFLKCTTLSIRISCRSQLPNWNSWQSIIA